MLKIRLMRIGAKKRPFYRVVVVDERKKRTGGYLDLIGTYDPLTQPKTIKLDQNKIDDWTKKGAQASTGFLRIIGKAPQRPPRKPKKAQEEKSQEAPKAEETKTEDKEAEAPANAEEAPAEATEETTSETPAETAEESTPETPAEETKEETTS